GPKCNVGDKPRVAVGGGLCDRVDGRYRRPARPVVDHDLLAERLRHAGRHDARRDVGGSTPCIGDQPADRLARIVLRLNTRNPRRQHNQRCAAQRAHHEGLQSAYSALIPASLITLAHFLTSTLMVCRACSGVPPTASSPCTAKPVWMSGMRKMALISAFSSFTIAAGVPAGA